MIDSRDITGLILAGGRGMRMGGVDKGWIEYRGRPLVEHVVERFAPQVGRLLISANRNIERYAALAEVVQDCEAPMHVEPFAGPLAGLLSGLRCTHGSWLAFVPCDAPCLPLELVARLASAADGVAAYARVGGQLQPTFGLVNRSTARALAPFMTAGGRAVHRWLKSLGAVVVDFDDSSAFININSPAP